VYKEKYQSSLFLPGIFNSFSFTIHSPNLAPLVPIKVTFKARCLFMMAKCSQKQIQKPQYFSFNYNWNKLDAAEKVYWPKFTSNIYFPELVI
jgi:hypothetical protein